MSLPLLSPEQLEAALPTAVGLEHRLQCPGARDGLRIHDNAVSTTPDSTIAALRSLPKGLHLMMGGRSKGLPLEDLVQVVGGKGRARGEFMNPQGVTLTYKGDILVTDSNNQCVQVGAWVRQGLRVQLNSFHLDESDPLKY